MSLIYISSFLCSLIHSVLSYFLVIRATYYMHTKKADKNLRNQ